VCHISDLATCRPSIISIVAIAMVRRTRQSLQQAARAVVAARIVAAFKGMDWPKRHFRYARLVRSARLHAPLLSDIRSLLSPCELLDGTGTGAVAPPIIILKNKVKRQMQLAEFGFFVHRR
jgi:hypothetical protein